MGCWNGTCMISNLPINVGEEIKLVLLHNKYMPAFVNPILGKSAYVYSNDLLSPAFMQIEGKYNDYGSIEDCIEDWNYKLIEKVIKEKCSKIKVEGDIMEDYNLTDIIKGIERGGLEIFSKPDSFNRSFAASMLASYEQDGDKSHFSEAEIEGFKKIMAEDTSAHWLENQFSFVMIRKDIWDHICSLKSETFWNEKKDEFDKDGKRKYYITAQEYCNRKFKKQIKDLKKLKASEYKELARLMMGAEGIFDREGGDGCGLYDKDSYSDALLDDSIDNKDIEKTWTEYTSIKSFISGTRKGWMIQAGAGSQHDGIEEHLALAEKIVEVCKEKIKEHEEY